MSVPVRPKGKEIDSLELFAKRIEDHLKMGKAGPLAMERLVCRLLTGKDPRISAMMASKWADWRYGKAKETIQLTGHIEHEHFDASKLSDEQLAEAERLIESASTGSDKG